MYAYAVSAAALLSFAPAVNAIGQAIIKNQCNENVYLWSVSDTVGDMQTLSPNGGVYNEPYRTNPDNGGISIKMATQPNQGGAITQFEYTLTNTLWYDISNINGYPFMNSGLTALPSSTSCRSVKCPANEAQCEDAYNVPSDNRATAACGTDSDVVVVLCSTQDDSAASAAASSALPSSSIVKANNAAVPEVTSAAAPEVTPAATSTTASVLAQPDVVAETTPVVKIGPNAQGMLEQFNDVFTTLVTVAHHRRAPTAVPEPEAAAIPEHKQRRHVHHYHQGERVLA